MSARKQPAVRAGAFELLVAQREGDVAERLRKSDRATTELQRDRDRLNRLSAAGWRVVFVTAADQRRPVREITERVAAALASA